MSGNDKKILVKANKHTWQRIKCSLYDHLLSHGSVSAVFFYRECIPAELVITALENVLTDFAIFAGILIKIKDQLYIECNNRGVQVNIEHINHALSINPLAEALDVAQCVDVINPLLTLLRGDGLFSIKLCYYSDGMTMGCSWHHSLGDMSTIMLFIKALSDFAQNKAYQPALVAEDRDFF